MIEITLTRERLRVTGHAEHAPKGEDVVCAGVSALAHALLLGLRDVLEIPIQEHAAESGNVDATWPRDLLGSEGEALVLTIQGAMHALSLRHPDRIRMVDAA